MHISVTGTAPNYVLNHLDADGKPRATRPATAEEAMMFEIINEQEEAIDDLQRNLLKDDARLEIAIDHANALAALPTHLRAGWIDAKLEQQAMAQADSTEG